MRVAEPNPAAETIYLGCYTAEGGGNGTGVMVARRDPATGRLSEPTLAAECASPSFLARHPRRPVLYAVNEVDEGTVSAWSVNGDRLRPLGSQSTGGSSPCHLAFVATGGHLVSANYVSGSVAVHPVDDDGALLPRTDLQTHSGTGPRPDRQEGPHAHMVSPDPDDAGLYVVDLGTDAVHRYLLDLATGTLTEPDPAMAATPGSGPRHLARHPDGRWAYLVGELDASVTAYEIDGAGGLTERERVPASESSAGAAGGAQPAEIAVGPGGRFLYVANRGPDTVAVFSLAAPDQPRYVTEVPSGGHWPRHFAIVGDHLYVANERSDSVGVFVIDPSDGVPAPVGDPVPAPTPTCVLPGF
ncbi:lactonase family protein [Solwaraspora sp. WMMD792]|uniref:lactonase family protein n=1 Tax=Solwaraspora sp. WMMD792 TaxID=3016099 RepID=UPI002417B084|nr:lactonase family protein [Solwaraspora sp. WMMD792]MDG4769493.1 lactonase family protein [Solwaraspora sp. WMMD792]